MEKLMGLQANLGDRFGNRDDPAEWDQNDEDEADH